MRACALTQQRATSCFVRRGGASSALRCRSSRLCAQSKLVLTPTGDGSTAHIDEKVDVPAAIQLKDGLFEIGRAAPADILIPLPTVSTRHCLVRVSEANGVLVTDLGSTNGTFVNGKELTAMEAVPLAVGGEVVFGDKYLAAFRLDNVSDPAAPAVAPADPLEDARVKECDDDPSQPECRVYDE